MRSTFPVALAVASVLLLLQQSVFGLAPPPISSSCTISVRRTLHHHSSLPSLWPQKIRRPLFLAATANSNANAALEDAAALKAQAEKIRLEAEKMDAQLTLEKVNTLEKKLMDKTWLERHPEEEALLRSKLQDLTNKLLKQDSSSKLSPSAAEPSTNMMTATTAAETTTSQDASATVSEVKWKESSSSSSRNPIGGFSSEDMDVYLPIARKIEETMSKNATREVKLEAFRTDPDILQRSSEKMQESFIKPLEDMGKIEEYTNQYLSSTSSVEKDRLKRQIDTLQASLAKQELFTTASTSSVATRGEETDVDVPQMSDQELQQRIDAIEALPEVLQSLYKQNNGVDLDDDLSLAILVEHYSPELDKLSSVRFLSTFPRTEQDRQKLMETYNAFPKAVQEYFCKKNMLQPGLDAEDVVGKVMELQQTMNTTLSELVSGGVDGIIGDFEVLPEYSDIEFIERSRFLEEFIPAFARMEGNRPTEEQIKTFYSDVLDKSTFALTGRPERVMGGYYIRGVNRFEGDSAGDKLVETLTEKLETSSLRDDLQFFYVSDPCPRTDEELLAGVEEKRLLAVTGSKPSEFYSQSNPQTKAAITSLGVVSAFVFALGTVGINGDSADRILQMAGSGSSDMSIFVGTVLATLVSLLGIQLVHEVAHRIVAWKDKFEIGLPNLIPSLSLGITGCITPYKSPPKNWNSMFDFAVAGPLAGIAASIALLYNGLGITASMDVASQNQLPALPVTLLHASALGGGLIESFLGSGVLTTSTPETAVLPLHPLAVSGFVGLISNALSLLPLGQTDGGRMWLSFMGRRGFFIVKTIATLSICAAGLFGLDESNLLLSYAIFVVIWQRELESPVRNEVDDLSLSRGVAAFAIAVLVGLTLIPLP